MNEFFMVLAATVQMMNHTGPTVSFDLFLDGKKYATQEECEEAISEVLPLVPGMLEEMAISGPDAAGNMWLPLPNKTSLICKATPMFDEIQGQEI